MRPRPAGSGCAHGTRRRALTPRLCFCVSRFPVAAAHQDELPRWERLGEALRERQEVAPGAEDAVHEDGGGRVLPGCALGPLDLSVIRGGAGERRSRGRERKFGWAKAGAPLVPCTC